MKYRFNTKPYPHQVRALKFLLRNRGGGLQVPMRWGKTKVAIDWVNCLALTDHVQRVLVVCPLSVTSVWPDEIDKHTRPASLFVEWKIINYEQLWTRRKVRDTVIALPNRELEKFNADVVIIDESHRIGNPSTLACRHACKIGQRARYRLIMTGTMFHRKPFYVFGQAKFYDPSIFGTAFGPFKKRIAVFGGYGGYEILKYTNLRWMMRKMKPWVFIEKYVPPRDTAVNVLKFNLTGEGLATYAHMETESMIEVNGEALVSPIVLSRHLRCQQIAGGWVKMRGLYVRVGKDKRQFALERFKEYEEQDIQKIVVGCRFIPELADVVDIARQCGYRVVLMHGGTVDRGKRIQFFQQTDKPCVFIAQIGTGAEGIDLSAADTMMFYSLSESFLTHDQFSRRIEKFEDTRVLQYDYVIARGTRDEVTFEALQLKQDVARFIVDHPARVERITARNRG